MVADVVRPAWDPVTNCMRRIGGPAPAPDNAGQMISSTLPAASVPTRTPGSPGTAARLVTRTVRPSAEPVAVVNVTVGAALVAQLPMRVITLLARSPVISTL